MVRALISARQALAGLLLALFAVLAVPMASAAHELRPAIADLSFPEGEARYELALILNLEALIAGIGPEHSDTDAAPGAARYKELRTLSPSGLERAFEGFAPGFFGGLDIRVDGAATTPSLTLLAAPPVGDASLPRDSRLLIGGPLPEGASAITIAWDARFGPLVLRAAGAGEGAYSAYLQPGEASVPIPVAGSVTVSAMAAFIDYLGVGFDHILPLGLDHILFVVGLFLLSTRLRPLLIQVTAFTLAHTVTLALGALGLVSLPGSVVEPLIALSITYVAVENIFSDRLHRWRPVVVFGFGLLHGLGFAGVLSEFGFAPGQFLASLIAFNIGVELGQLTVIAICFLLVGLWFGDRDWYRPRIVWPASLAIGGYSFTWFLERSLEIDVQTYLVVLLTAVLGTLILLAKRVDLRSAQAGFALTLGAFLTVGLRLAEGAIG